MAQHFIEVTDTNHLFKRRLSIDNDQRLNGLLDTINTIERIEIITEPNHATEMSQFNSILHINDRATNEIPMYFPETLTTKIKSVTTQKPTLKLIYFFAQIKCLRLQWIKKTEQPDLRPRVTLTYDTQTDDLTIPKRVEILEDAISILQHKLSYLQRRTPSFRNGQTSGNETLPNDYNLNISQKANEQRRTRYRSPNPTGGYYYPKAMDDQIISTNEMMRIILETPTCEISHLTKGTINIDETKALINKLKESKVREALRWYYHFTMNELSSQELAKSRSLNFRVTLQKIKATYSSTAKPTKFLKKLRTGRTDLKGDPIENFLITLFLLHTKSRREEITNSTFHCCDIFITCPLNFVPDPTTNQLLSTDQSKLSLLNENSTRTITQHCVNELISSLKTLCLNETSTFEENTFNDLISHSEDESPTSVSSH